MLTAGGCVAGFVPFTMIARAGSNSYNSGQTRIVSAINIRLDYDPMTGENDIAVVKTLQPFVTGPTVQPISLGSTLISSGTPARVSGWGATSSQSNTPVNNLRFLNTQTISNAVCQSRHGSARTIFDSQICTSAGPGTGACQVSYDPFMVNIYYTQQEFYSIYIIQGDSGGPLTSFSGTNVIGAVSWGISCSQGFPDVFARVSSFRPWILQQL